MKNTRDSILGKRTGIERLYVANAMLHGIFKVAQGQSAGEPAWEAVLELSKEAHSIIDGVFSELLNQEDGKTGEEKEDVADIREIEL